MTGQLSVKILEVAPDPVTRSPRKQAASKKSLLAGRKLFVCYYCVRTTPDTQASLEHIIPLSYGGTFHPDNLTLACKTCNSARNNIVQKIKANRPISRKSFADYLWRHIVQVGDQYYFEPPTPDSGGKPQAIPAPNSLIPVPATPTQNIADMSWFKTKVGEIATLIRKDPYEAWLLATAIATIPRHMRPTTDPAATQAFMDEYRAQKRAYIEATGGFQQLVDP